MTTFEFSYSGNPPSETISKITTALEKGEMFGLENVKHKDKVIVFAPKQLAVVYPSSPTTFLNPSPTLQTCKDFEAFKAVIGMSLYRYNIFVEGKKAIELTPCELLT